MLLGTFAHRSGRAAATASPRHLDAAAGPEVLGIAQAVEVHQPLHAGAVALGDFGEGFAGLHGVVAAAAARNGAATAAGHADAAAGPEVLGAAQAIQLHQPLDARAVALRQLRQGLARLHHHLTGKARQGQQQG